MNMAFFTFTWAGVIRIVRSAEYLVPGMSAGNLGKVETRHMYSIIGMACEQDESTLFCRREKTPEGLPQAQCNCQIIILPTPMRDIENLLCTYLVVTGDSNNNALRAAPARGCHPRATAPRAR